MGWETELGKIFQESKTDKWEHKYQKTYGEVFDVIGEPEKLIEIGISRCGSAGAWYTAFKNTNIYAVDIERKDPYRMWRTLKNSKRVHFLYGYDSTQEHHRYAPHFKFDEGPADVIIDDGNHLVQYQFATWIVFHRHFKEAYIIEDIIGDYNLEILKHMVSHFGYECKVEKSEKPIPETQKVPKNLYIMTIYHKDSKLGKFYNV